MSWQNKRWALPVPWRAILIAFLCRESLSGPQSGGSKDHGSDRRVTSPARSPSFVNVLCILVFKQQFPRKTMGGLKTNIYVDVSCARFVGRAQGWCRQLSSSWFCLDDDFARLTSLWQREAAEAIPQAWQLSGDLNPVLSARPTRAVANGFLFPCLA